MELLSALATANHSNDSGNPADGTGWYLFTTLNGNKVTIWNVLISILNVTVVVFNLWLNGLVLDTMIRQKKSQEPADLLIAGLAFTDVLVGLTTLWITIYNFVFFQNMYECLVRLCMVHSVMIVGMLHLLCLTLDRFLRITQPYRYLSLCGRRTMYIVLAAVWIGGIQLGSLPTFGWNLYKEVASSSGKHICIYFRIMHPSYIGFNAVFVLTVIVLMWLIYTRLFFVARKHIHAMAFLQTRSSAPITLSTDQRQKSSTGSGSGSFRSRFMSDHAWRYTRTVVLIVGVNCAAWFPTGIVVVLSVTGSLDYLDDVDKGSLLMYVSTLVYCNSIVNPLIYGTQISAIRYRFRRVFCQRRTMSRQGTDRSTGPFFSSAHALFSFGHTMRSDTSTRSVSRADPSEQAVIRGPSTTSLMKQLETESYVVLNIKYDQDNASPGPSQTRIPTQMNDTITLQAHHHEDGTSEGNTEHRLDTDTKDTTIPQTEPKTKNVQFQTSPTDEVVRQTASSILLERDGEDNQKRLYKASVDSALTNFVIIKTDAAEGEV